MARAWLSGILAAGIISAVMGSDCHQILALSVRCLPSDIFDYYGGRRNASARSRTVAMSAGHLSSIANVVAYRHRTGASRRSSSWQISIRLQRVLQRYGPHHGGGAVLEAQHEMGSACSASLFVTAGICDRDRVAGEGPQAPRPDPADPAAADRLDPRRSSGTSRGVVPEPAPGSCRVLRVYAGGVRWCSGRRCAWWFSRFCPTRRVKGRSGSISEGRRAARSRAVFELDPIGLTGTRRRQSLASSRS